MVNGRGAVPSRKPEAAGRLPLGRRQQFSQRRERRDEDPGQICDEQGIDRIEPATTYATSITCSTAGRSTVSSRTASVPIGSYQERWEIPCTTNYVAIPSPN